MAHLFRRSLLCLMIACAGLLSPRTAAAYSILGHESTVDAAWEDVIVPLLRQRFPRATKDQLLEARAYAYGGSVIQDLGYFPFGSHLFTNLVHYVRSGDFVEALIRDATDLDEYAFALGALAHYSSDNAGHPIAVNRALPIMYPKERAKFGDQVIYAKSPKRHLMVEFAYDVQQVSNGAYAAEAYHDYIGFQVSKPLLERAFLETYGLEMKDLFLDEDLAIGTFRWAVGTTIPQMTRIAWRDKHDEIVKARPGVTRDQFLFSLKRQQFEKDFGAKYRRPGVVARMLGFTLKVIPKVGLFRPLAFKPLTPETERLFRESFAQARERYRTSLQAVRAGRLNLANTDLDTGVQPVRGANTLADDTYRDLLARLADHQFAAVPAALRVELNRYYATGEPAAREARDKHAVALRVNLTQMNASATRSR